MPLGVTMVAVSPTCFAHQAAPDRRCGGDQALGDVRLLAGDEPVHNLFVLGGVVDNDGRAESSLVVRNVGQIHERELGHASFQLAEARVDELLALLRHVVLGVFRQIAQRHSLFDLRGQFVGEFVLEDLNLLEQLVS